ncbi:hypothetical protein, partial [Xanthomonas arboricola]|uniref:hypothetical protein n=1 Tax=Xanthomonas arboricola TaxID=56448 RepID=UPI001955C72E
SSAGGGGALVFKMDPKKERQKAERMQRAARWTRGMAASGHAGLDRCRRRPERPDRSYFRRSRGVDANGVPRQGQR